MEIVLGYSSIAYVQNCIMKVDTSYHILRLFLRGLRILLIENSRRFQTSELFNIFNWSLRLLHEGLASFHTVYNIKITA